MELIGHRLVKIRDAVKALPLQTPESVRVDVEIFEKAVDWAMRHNEFFDGGKSMLATLGQLGQKRAQDAAEGKWLIALPQGKKIVQAYRSAVDGSVQPYAVSYPADYGDDKNKKWRLDIVLHGRDKRDLRRDTSSSPSTTGRMFPKRRGDFVQIDIYGRGNNAYRWAGETDVFEAINDFLQREQQLGRGMIDPQACTVLRGFSMGGAGTWHLGLHHPDRWCVIGPGVAASRRPIPTCEIASQSASSLIKSRSCTSMMPSRLRGECLQSADRRLQRREGRAKGGGRQYRGSD